VTAHCGQCAACDGTDECTCCCDSQCELAGDCCWDYSASQCAAAAAAAAAASSAPFTVFEAAPAQPAWAEASPTSRDSSSLIKLDAAGGEVASTVTEQSSPPRVLSAAQPPEQQPQRDWIDDWTVEGLPQPAAVPQWPNPSDDHSDAVVQARGTSAWPPVTGVAIAAGSSEEQPTQADAATDVSSMPPPPTSSNKPKLPRWGPLVLIFVLVCGGMGMGECTGGPPSSRSAVIPHQMI
jgi:hypothetical protein